jgi:hypothetical protein
MAAAGDAHVEAAILKLCSQHPEVCTAATGAVFSTAIRYRFVDVADRQALMCYIRAG